jgi:hypothetical protein
VVGERPELQGGAFISENLANHDLELVKIVANGAF